MLLLPVFIKPVISISKTLHVHVPKRPLECLEMRRGSSPGSDMSMAVTNGNVEHQPNQTIYIQNYRAGGVLFINNTHKIKADLEELMS